MSFEEALQKMAEKWPEKFEIPEECPVGGYYFRIKVAFVDSQGYEVKLQRDIAIKHPASSIGKRETQDDVDEILAEIGWEYEVHPSFSVGKVRWTPIYWKTERLVDVQPPPDLKLDSKLEAARAALIAVVEHETK